MKVSATRLPGVVLLEPQVYHDARGSFCETWHQSGYAGLGLPSGFVQDNVSVSAPGVLRGLHLQSPSCQSKLVTVLAGSIFDVAVDVRAGSPTFGQWVGAALSAANRHQFFIPAGFAHGFVVTGEEATVFYKCDAYYAPREELTVLWNDPDLGIDWPDGAPTLSAKDQQGLRLRDVPVERLPVYRG